MTKRVLYKFEYSFKAKAQLLYSYVSVSYNLANWFADDVQVDSNKLIFTWNKSSESVQIVKEVLKKHISYKWIEREADEMLTFNIETDEVTGGTTLVVTDYDDEDQVPEARMWWDAAIERLKRIIGS